MKKKKSDSQLPAGFKNSPFKPLKGFTPQTPSIKKAGTFGRKKEQPTDDKTLFLRAVSGTRRIQKDEEPGLGQANPEGLDAGAVVESEDRELFLKAMQKIGATFEDLWREEEELQETEPRTPTSRMRLLKRGSIRIGDELDLHGFLRDEALARLDSFISGSRERGLEAVLVITGKGINSPEGPVLKQAAAAWLSGRGKRMVAEFSPAPRDKGGSGAFVVFLRKK